MANRTEHQVEIKLTEALTSAVELGNEVNRLRAALREIAHVDRWKVTRHEIVKPCGCIVTTERGHVHTKMCDTHRREAFLPRGKVVEPNNLDLIGG
jgi:hypothetical protein